LGGHLLGGFHLGLLLEDRAVGLSQHHELVILAGEGSQGFLPSVGSSGVSLGESQGVSGLQLLGFLLQGGEGLRDLLQESLDSLCHRPMLGLACHVAFVTTTGHAAVHDVLTFDNSSALAAGAGLNFHRSVSGWRLVC